MTIYFKEGLPIPINKKLRKIRFDTTGLWGNYVEKNDVFSKQWIEFSLVRECVKYVFFIRNIKLKMNYLYCLIVDYYNLKEDCAFPKEFFRCFTDELRQHLRIWKVSV